ncbi:MAG: hypothetical protein KY475_05725, partial [Planctomycetes bacterium]|nr:hypothetical protein [Planctomycetota bacterium]
RSEIFRWDAGKETWRRLPWRLPEHASIITPQGSDAGLRFLDIDHDGDLDAIFSNAERYSLHLFDSMEKGWSIAVHDSLRADGNAIPPFVRPDGTNNGVWFHSNHLWVQNEDTARLPDLVDRRSFAELLAPLKEPSR